MSWRFLDTTCQIFAFSGPKKNWVTLQELPKFDISQAKIVKMQNTLTDFVYL